MRMSLHLGVRFQNPSGPSKIYQAVVWKNACGVPAGANLPYPDQVMEGVAKALAKYINMNDPDSARFIDEVGIANGRKPSSRKPHSFVVATGSGGSALYIVKLKNS